MSILWIYDKQIDPHAGGTERATQLIMTALAERGYPTARFLVFCQEPPRDIYDAAGKRIDDLYGFMIAHDVHVIVNQIGYSKWLLEEFLTRGGERWKQEGGRIVTNLHFDPLMFQTGLRDLTRHWSRRSPKQKLRRLGRIAMLPLEWYRVRQTLRYAYRYLLENSDAYVILSERHRQKFHEISGAHHADRVHVIANPNTFSTALAAKRLPLKSNTVLIVSRLDEPQKRLSLALLAWGKVMRVNGFSDWKLKVLGDGDYLEDYHNLIARKRIANVEFVGRTDPEPFYEDAALYLHTAKREGWGMTITEAMQKGVVPIVMNSSPVFGDFIEDGFNGVLVKDGDIEEFSKCISELMIKEDRRQAMALNAIVSISRNSLHSIVSKWVKIVA